MPEPITQTKSLRFFHLDALRGVAALGVLIYHIGFCSALWIGPKALPGFVGTLGDLLAYGVELFFVLSGWVIAHSMRRESLGFASLKRFLTRRAFRLTPPYWVAIVFALVFKVAEYKISPGDPLPTPSQVALNFVYLQNILGAVNVFTPAWTLCIEAQFYVAFAVMLWLAGRLGRGGERDEVYGARRVPLALLLFVGMLGTIALSAVWSDTALFVSWWYYFAGGALAYLASRDARLRPLIFTGLVAMLALSVGQFITMHRPHPTDLTQGCEPVLVGALGLAYLLAAHGREKWMSWGQAGVFEWLGRVSYSLYLTHFGFGLFVAKVLRKAAKDNAGQALFFIVVDIVLCLILAGVFWKWVEQPSIEWAKRFKLRGDAVRESSGAPASHSAPIG